jgi:hypothetical protein
MRKLGVTIALAFASVMVTYCAAGPVRAVRLRAMSYAMAPSQRR